MPRLHSLELLPDARGSERVREEWQALRDAGLASQLDHRGSTNTPHLTVVEAPALAPELEEEAARTIASLLPLGVRLTGVALLGTGPRVALVRPVESPDRLTAAVLALRSRTPGAQHAGWLPHLTLARRLPRDDVPAALAALASLPRDDEPITLSGLRRWDPGSGTVRAL